MWTNDDIICSRVSHRVSRLYKPIPQMGRRHWWWSGGGGAQPTPLILIDVKQDSYDVTRPTNWVRLTRLSHHHTDWVMKAGGCGCIQSHICTFYTRIYLFIHQLLVMLCSTLSCFLDILIVFMSSPRTLIAPPNFFLLPCIKKFFVIIIMIKKRLLFLVYTFFSLLSFFQYDLRLNLEFLYLSASLCSVFYSSQRRGTNGQNLTVSDRQQAVVFC